jgi:hypothetical protein
MTCVARTIFPSLVVLALVCAGLGCESSSNPPRYTLPPPQQLVPAGARLAAAGAAPISTYIQGPAGIYIIDDTRGALVHTSTVPADGSGLIELDPTEKQIVGTASGSAARERTLLGPIDPKHRYSIWVQGGQQTGSPTSAGTATNATTQP